VKINIPEILIHLRSEVVRHGDAPFGEILAMKASRLAMETEFGFALSQSFARLAQVPFTEDKVIHSLPGMLANWTSFRDLPAIPPQSFRQWWAERGDK
jgi:L-lactate dehydrogenase complex protein LldF